MNSNNKLTSISRFLSLVLRHEPQRIGLELDEAGWTPVEALLHKAARAGHPISRADLDEVVATSDKRRFAFSGDGLRIRANQGHSVAVDLGLPPLPPPESLYHGTASRFRDAILRDGLQRRERHHVHLTESVATAMSVGQRYGQPVLLRVDARRMATAGHEFRCSANGVWLVDSVPPEFLEVQPWAAT